MPSVAEKAAHNLSVCQNPELAGKSAIIIRFIIMKKRR